MKEGNIVIIMKPESVSPGVQESLIATVLCTDHPHTRVQESLIGDMIA